VVSDMAAVMQGVQATQRCGCAHRQLRSVCDETNHQQLCASKHDKPKSRTAYRLCRAACIDIIVDIMHNDLIKSPFKAMIA